MTENEKNKIYDALKELFNHVKDISNHNDVAFEVFINHEGFEYSFKSREASSLKRDGVSMRNIKGDWIV